MRIVLEQCCYKELNGHNKTARSSGVSGKGKNLIYIERSRVWSGQVSEGRRNSKLGNIGRAAGPLDPPLDISRRRDEIGLRADCHCLHGKVGSSDRCNKLLHHADQGQ